MREVAKLLMACARPAGRKQAHEQWPDGRVKNATSKRRTGGVKKQGCSVIARERSKECN